MASQVNVTKWAKATLGPGQQHNWFLDVNPANYNAARRRVRTFSAVPFVFVPEWHGPDRPLPLPEDFPVFEQRVAVTLVFHLLKGTPAVPPGTPPPPAPQLQINVIVTNLMKQFPVTYELYMAETDN